MATSQTTLAMPITGKCFAFFCLSFFLVISASAQSYGIDDSLKHIPRSRSGSISDVVKFIEEKALSDKDKARGAYYYVAHTIRYDVNKFLKDEPSYSDPIEVFEKRKAVCIGYANLYREMCTRMGLTCKVISGYSRGYGYRKGQEFTETDHAWNAVKIDSTWYLVDATWASGDIQKKFYKQWFVQKFYDDFFGVAPEEFILTHAPDMPMWQLLDYPVSMKNFAAGNVKLKKPETSEKGRYHYLDTINAYFTLDETHQLWQHGRMAVRYNKKNTISMAYGMLFPIVSLAEKKSFVNADMPLYTVDSMITVITSATDLLKKKTGSRKAIKELATKNLDIAQDLLSELYLMKAEFYEKRIRIENISSFDTLMYCSRPMIESCEKAIRVSHDNKNSKLSNELNNDLCERHMFFYYKFRGMLMKEEDAKKRKVIQKQIDLHLSSAKKFATVKSPCYRFLKEL